jgi:uridine kinase
LSQDNFYKECTDEEMENIGNYNFDHPDALESDLLVRDVKVLCSGQSVEIPSYDFATHLRRPLSQWRRVDPRPVVLVEGILILAVPELRALLDGVVFVQASEAVRLRRRLARDVEERGREEEDVRKQFVATVAPMHDRFVEPYASTAGLIVDGEGDVEESLRSVEAYITRLREQRNIAPSSG